jgi:uncharacterized protein DUF5666
LIRREDRNIKLLQEEIMNKKNVLLAAGGLIVVMTLIFHGCSSSSSGGGAAPLTGPNVSRGVITGFGSVIVNGIHFDVSKAAVSVEGTTADVSALKLGMEVTVKSDGQAASSINSTNELEGPISGISGTNMVAVLGETVKTDASTVFAGNATGHASLPAGSIAEVHGFRDSAGVIHATRVEVKSIATASTAVESKGIVSNLTSSTFKMHGLVVSFGTATLKDFPTAGIANGQSVKVKSTHGKFDAATSTLVAESVETETESELHGTEGEHCQIQGVVTDFVSVSNFKVNGITVNASGSGATGLANDMRVELEGTIDANGVLIATTFKSEQESETESGSGGETTGSGDTGGHSGGTAARF